MKKECENCGGTGRVDDSIMMAFPPMFLPDDAECPECGGSGFTGSGKLGGKDGLD